MFGERPKLIYYRHSEGLAAGRYSGREDTDVVDDIVIEGLRSRDLWEFTVALRDIEGVTNQTLEVHAFDDSFQAFADFKKFFAWLAQERPTTLDEVQQWLDESGVINGIEHPEAKA